ncbi:hypothetical protein TNCV_3637531 [Trichonephila clavipes]|nr:hypothetical protein TNCV_3637531 [Trichonephila clavipes]
MQRCFDIHLWISFTPNAAVVFVDVAIQPEVRFIAKQNLLMKIRNNGNLVLGPFDESTSCLMIVLMNCQTKLRINHLTAHKSVAILENEKGIRSIMEQNLLRKDCQLVTYILHILLVAYEPHEAEQPSCNYNKRRKPQTLPIVTDSRFVRRRRK